MAFTEIDGARVHYVQLEPEGDGEREDLVMVHGLGTSLSYWFVPHAVELARRYRVTLYDLPGHGSSGSPESGYTPQRLARTLELLLDALDIGRAHLVAHSFGGVIALGLASSRPERVLDLVLADTQVHGLRGLGPNQAEPSRSKLQELLRRHGVDIDVGSRFFGFHLLGAVARLHASNREISPELATMLGPLAGRRSRQTAKRWLELLQTTRAEAELMSDDGLTPERLGRVEAPVLAMYGERSRCFPCGMKLARLLPRASFLSIPDAGHFFPSSRPELFLEHCQGFWEPDRVIRQAQ